MLLERKRLTSGTTWHAAGLVGQLRATANLTKLAQYTTELYASLEAETGQATGFMQRGSLLDRDELRAHGRADARRLDGEDIRARSQRGLAGGDQAGIGRC